jgi:hypothetical protein
MKPIRNGKKCGPNESCPCGSQKKLKKCCKKASHRLPRQVYPARAIASNPDFLAIAGTKVISEITQLLVNNNLPGQLVYLFYQTGTVFSEYNIRFLTEQAAQTVIGHIQRWSNMSTEQQQAWLDNWRQDYDDAD